MLVDNHGLPPFLDAANKKKIRTLAIRHCFRIRFWFRVFIPTVFIIMPIVGVVDLACKHSISRWLLRLASTSLVVAICMRYINREYAKRVRYEVEIMQNVCQSCGYDLHDNLTGLCPECGHFVRRLENTSENLTGR